MDKTKNFKGLYRECFDLYKKSIDSYLDAFFEELRSCDEYRAEEIIYSLQRAATRINDCAYPDEDNPKDADLDFYDAEELAFKISEEFK